MFILTQLSISVSNVTFQPNLTFSANSNSALLSYGVNWVIDTFSNSSGQFNRVYRSGLLINTTKLNFTASQQYGAFNINPQTSIYSIIDKSNKIYSYYSNVFSNIFISNFTIDKISYLDQNTLTCYNKSLKTVYLH
jgi:hypothetical protein